MPNGRVASKAQIAEMDERALAIRKIAENTPEVRYREAGVYSDDEIKIIAAAIVSRIPLYKVAATLKCSLARILKAVEETPTLKQMMEEQKIQEKMMAQEAVDDCIKARVPAVVMWHAQHVLPEKYGDQVNMDNEDDTRIVIGGIDESLVAEAEKEVEEASKTIPLAGGGVALLDAMEQERAAETAAAGGGYLGRPARSNASCAVFGASCERFEVRSVHACVRTAPDAERKCSYGSIRR